MSYIWHNRVSHGINRIGYDINTESLVIIFCGGRIAKSHQDVPYSLYTQFAYSPFPDRFYRQNIEGKYAPVPSSSYIW